ncbi:uncharacterized protein LOC116423913 [Nomia melanderi]|uniref:uncharacterized protein LOC116423913 n=1 Tax=Nomia melanderi TaxID=2448451 RepID=UPI003FCCC5C4
MEACQRSDKKHEPETLRCIDFDVKHEDHKQTSFTVNAPILQSTMGWKPHQDNAGRKEQGSSSADPVEDRATKRIKFFESAFTRCEQNPRVQRAFEDNRGRPSNRLGKLQQEGTRFVDDQPRNLAKLIQRNPRGWKKMPAPRSNVHTARSPIVQPAIANPLLDPNGMTIRLLRLAVLLYAPALMPALNLLIARQSSQTTIPIPYFEGSNDLLTQLLRTLSNQQSVPNLSYASPREEISDILNSSNPPRPNLELSQTVSRQPEDDTDSEHPEASEREKNSSFKKPLE